MEAVPVWIETACQRADKAGYARTLRLSCAKNMQDLVGHGVSQSRRVH